MGAEGYFPEGNETGRKANHSLPSIAEVKIDGAIHTPPILKEKGKAVPVIGHEGP
jgi:hypothetical protein